MISSLRGVFRDMTMTREQANREFLSRLESSMRQYIGDSARTIISFKPESGPMGELGNCDWGMGDDAIVVNVWCGPKFDARNATEAYRVAQTAFHESRHAQQYQMIRGLRPMDDSVSKEVGLDLIATSSCDAYRYKEGYVERPCEIDANRAAMVPARDFCREWAPWQDFDTEAVRSYFERYGYLDGYATNTAEDTEHAIRNHLFRKCRQREPQAMEWIRGSSVSNYLMDYASDDFIREWRDAKSDGDRTRLAVAAEMAMCFTDGKLPSGANLRREFAWHDIDWTLSSGANACELTGVFNADGSYIMSRYPDGRSTGTGRVPIMRADRRNEYEWSSANDVLQRLRHQLKDKLVLCSVDGYGYADSRGIAMPDGTIHSLNDKGALSYVLRSLSDRSFMVAPQSHMGPVGVVSDWVKAFRGDVSDANLDWKASPTGDVYLGQSVVKSSPGMRRTPIYDGGMAYSGEAAQMDF